MGNLSNSMVRTLDSKSGHQKSLQLLRQLIRAEEQVAEAQPARWLCRRGIAGGGGLVRGGKELLLEARDSGVALLQQLQAFLAFEQPLLAFEQPFLAVERSHPQLLGFLLDVVHGSPVERRQGGKVETHSDLVMGRESAEAGEVVIAVVRGERNQEQQGGGQKGVGLPRFGGQVSGLHG